MLIFELASYLRVLSRVNLVGQSAEPHCPQTFIYLGVGGWSFALPLARLMPYPLVPDASNLLYIPLLPLGWELAQGDTYSKLMLRGGKERGGEEERTYIYIAKRPNIRVFFYSCEVG